MATNVATFGSASERQPLHWASVSPFIVLAGRTFFALIFLIAATGHFSHKMIEYAGAQGVPLATLLVPASGLLSFAGGLSILLGFHARVGAWLLVLFLVPVTLAMHKFWTIGDPMVAQVQMAMFMKNIAMLGAALFFSQVGAGPLSLDARREGRLAAQGG